jgi:superfamily II helicase
MKMSLKDALKKAGLSSTKTVNERDQKQLTKAEKHQGHRNFCEVCEFIQPDVERFSHKHPRIDAEWICSNCADKNEILDDFRMTNQSDSAKKGTYRRYYGHIKDFKKVENVVQKDNRSSGKFKHDKNKPHRTAGNQNRNRNGNGNKKPAANYKIDDDGEKNFNC